MWDLVEKRPIMVTPKCRDSNFNLSEFIKVPSFGCFKDERNSDYKNREACIQKIWSIGGQNGWYYGNWLWKFRGFIDKLFGVLDYGEGEPTPIRFMLEKHLIFGECYTPIKKKVGYYFSQN